ncbi:ankyrin repeat-containing protein [Striga asiatica]|uniref:Ankyrin repeat-containing protein n=1 Tax=Striga asiatica TaxID=4170 RepID=A0A5A7RD19_STRAF|nr:ankyrin repeat-containing protein [Striga asiatica]
MTTAQLYSRKTGVELTDDEGGDSEIPVHLRPLVSAAESGDVDALRLALERAANIEAKDEDGGIPLHDACAAVREVQIAQLLINSANNPERVRRMLETVDMEGDTVPLHHAARGEYADTVRLLLAYEACPTKTNFYGKYWLPRARRRASTSPDSAAETRGRRWTGISESPPSSSVSSTSSYSNRAAPSSSSSRRPLGTAISV